MPVKQSRELGEGTKVEKDESLTDGGKSPMMTIYETMTSVRPFKT